MKCFGRLHSHRFSHGDKPFGLLLVDVSVSLAVHDPVSDTRMASSLSGTIDRAAKRLDRGSKGTSLFMIATKTKYSVVLSWCVLL
jgi:hypothetical protein